MSEDLARLSPDEFCALLRRQGIRRFYLVWDEEERRVRASHEVLAPLARLLEEDGRDFDRHEGVFVQISPRTGVLQGAFVHRTCRGQGAGGLRFWSYDTVAGFLRDGLRLAKGMTQKNALAGLWWGGGKGVMARGTGDHAAAAADPELRRAIYEDYGAFISSLRGCYVTAEDVGTSVEDMRAVFARTRFTTCVPEELGGSGNPSVPTARGVVEGMEAALAHRGLGTLAGKTVALQGLGHVGQPLLGFLAERGVARVVATDVDEERCREARERVAEPGLELEARAVDRGDLSLFETEAHILAPCATGGALNPRTIPRLRAPIVCGAANNQLEDPARDDDLLAARGVLYVPDFLVNRMGIVTCADEGSGYLEPDPAIERHLGREWDNSIYNLARRVLREAERKGVPPARVAVELADRRSLEPHPIWGHRGARIIAGLVAGGWAC